MDEYTYCQTLGSAEASNRLTQHWNSWITQADFNEIASVGLNHVRIPIGYWALNPLPGDPYVQGQLPILDNAITWARQAGLKVMLDLHGGMTLVTTIHFITNIAQLLALKTVLTTLVVMARSTGNRATPLLRH